MLIWRLPCSGLEQPGEVEWTQPDNRRNHEAPYYTDDLMHNLHVERFYRAHVSNGLIAPSGGDGPIKTPDLQGLKDTPPYFHDDRRMTSDDTVEFFHLILGTKLTPREKKDLVAFMRTL
jgi:cytochrome c peroxidase